MIMASCPVAKYRDGKKAVEIATHACELTQWKRSDFLDTLAAAYAEAGDFNAAIKWETKAIETMTDERTREPSRARLILYEAGKPYHEPFYGLVRTEVRP